MRSAFIFCLCAIALSVGAVISLGQLSADDLKFRTWAVLAAGSSGWSNYRHQADVCHAYHVLHSIGIPEDHIIVMMVDDLAYNTKNRFPGKLFNDENVTKDVYQGVPRDYTGNLVSGKNFLRILSGDVMDIGSKKSLMSGPDDNVFVFFDDHGDYDALIFPHDDVSSSDMQALLDTMAKNNMYKNLIFYIEACMSGSVFYKLNYTGNVYVTTAAPIGVFSYAGCYNKNLSAYACDAYSYSWIHDLELNHRANYSFSDQFDVIQKSLKGLSQGCWYGEKKIFDMPIGDFFEPSFDGEDDDVPVMQSRPVSNFDLELELAKNTFLDSQNDEALVELNKEIAIRKAIDDMGIAIVSAAKPDAPHLASTPCTVCSESSCSCYKNCVNDYGTICDGKKNKTDCCKFECCNEESCYVDPTVPSSEIERRDTCIKTLTKAFTESCGRGHPYLLKTTLLFMRVCKQQDIRMDSALDEIRSQCSNFDINSF